MNNKELLKTIQNDIKNIDEYIETCISDEQIDHLKTIKKALKQYQKKPVVPQFVAEWYEEHKDNFEIYLSELCINFTCHRERLNDKLANWYEQLENKPTQTLVNMHQFGYEVEKEKLDDNTNKTPSHYQGTIQPIDLINAQDLNFNLGNVVKYVSRAGKKQGENVLSDLEKAKNYINYEIERIKKNE